MFQSHGAISDAISNEVMTQVDVFRAFMMAWILAQINAALIV